MDKVKREDLKEITEALKETASLDENTSEIMETLTRLLAMPDEQFSIFAPGVLQSYQQALNNPTDKIALAQAFNASGEKIDDLTGNFLGLMDEIDKVALPRVKKDFLKEIFSAIYNAINDTEGIAKRNVQVAIELCHEDAKIPQYAHITDSGADVFALEDITIPPGQTVLVPTGLKVSLPPGFEIQVRAKSGRALNTKLRLANAIGTIDQGYRDEIKVIIENVDPRIRDLTVDDEGRITSIEYGRDYYIGKGEKFCQLVLMEVPKAAYYSVDKVSILDKEDRGGGFGSTGLK